MNIKHFSIAIIATLMVLNLAAMEQAKPIIYDPNIVVHIINKTDQGYNIAPIQSGTSGTVANEERATIVKAQQTTKVDLTKDWHYPNEMVNVINRTNGLIIGKGKGNTLLTVFINFYPEYSPGMLDVSLAGVNDWTAFDSGEVKFNNSRKTDFLINLYLDGDDLKKSHSEITAIER